MLEVCDFATSLGKVHSKSDLVADTLSVILRAKTLKLLETRKWLLQEDLKMT